MLQINLSRGCCLRDIGKFDLPQAVIEGLIDSGDYDTKEDFTVVVQPFFMGVDVPYKASNCIAIVLFTSCD